jgi:membrane-bound metal-dependent hydrolase YbcI (DUF457 family)
VAPPAAGGLDSDQGTKIAPLFPAPSPGLVRDVSVALFFGQHRGNSAAARTLLFAAIVVLLVWATLFVRREGRTAVWLLAGTLVGNLLLHAALRLVDIAQPHRVRFGASTTSG